MRNFSKKKVILAIKAYKLAVDTEANIANNFARYNGQNTTSLYNLLWELHQSKCLNFKHFFQKSVKYFKKFMLAAGTVNFAVIVKNNMSNGFLKRNESESTAFLWKLD